MALESRLSLGICELCEANGTTIAFDLGECPLPADERRLCVCSVCEAHLTRKMLAPNDHWRALATAIWSEFDSVKAAAKLILQTLRPLPWAQDLEDQIYLPDEVISWLDQQHGNSVSSSDDTPLTRDSNGTVLAEGDSVTLIKDLEVKGAGFTAKRGTLVKQIRLTDDPKFIEGRVNGTTIVLVSAYLKKA